MSEQTSLEIPDGVPRAALTHFGGGPVPVEIEHRRAHKFVKDGRGCGATIEATGKRCGRAKTNPLHHGAPPSLNASGSGRNEFAYRNAKASWQERLVELLDATDLPRGLDSVLVEGVVCFPDRIRRDQGNFRYFLEKALGDALQAGGWLADDDWDSYEFGGLSKTYERGVTWTRLTIFPDALVANGR